MAMIQGKDSNGVNHTLVCNTSGVLLSTLAVSSGSISITGMSTEAKQDASIALITTIDSEVYE